MAGREAQRRVRHAGGRLRLRLRRAVPPAPWHRTHRNRVLPRRGTERHAFELGILALQLFAATRPDIEIHLYGERVGRLPFPFVDHGVVSVDDLNSIYNRCFAALSLSMTNVSLVPYEMLAAGCVPVVNDAHHNRVVLDNAFVHYAEPTPPALTRALVDVVERPEFERAVPDLARSVSGASWSDAGASVEATITPGTLARERSLRMTRVGFRDRVLRAAGGKDGSLAARMRRRRFEHIRALLSTVPSPYTILDVGGEPDYWQTVGVSGTPGVEIVLLNLKPVELQQRGMRSLVGTATDMREFADSGVRGRLLELCDRTRRRPRRPKEDGRGSSTRRAAVLRADTESLLPDRAPFPLPVLRAPAHLGSCVLAATSRARLVLTHQRQGRVVPCSRGRSDY